MVVWIDHGASNVAFGMAAENDTDTDTDSLRLTAEELAFLLSDPQSRADREERNARANRSRT
ncbi:hypothetical protein SB780_41595, partial [Burkholderia sp. SIMBA_057]